ncbi:MAG: hypothetical protein WDO15_11335 [Bacteroidota bacterium]
MACDENTKRDLLEKMELDEFVVRFTDANGKLKIFGTLDSPVQFLFNHDSGESCR